MLTACYRSLVTVMMCNGGEDTGGTVGRGGNNIMGGTIMGAKDRDTNEVIGVVIAKVKARLFASSVSWLLVFDNLNYCSLLNRFFPEVLTVGGKHPRHHSPRNRSQPPHHGFIALEYFEPSHILRRSASPANVDKAKNAVVAAAIAERLGNFRWHLAVACDVGCKEY